ncbi:MAG: LptA/OstA family protein [bacterium]
MSSSRRSIAWCRARCTVLFAVAILPAALARAQAPAARAPSTPPPAAAATESGGGFLAGELFSSKGGPIEIRAGSFLLQNASRTLRYEGNVEATQADTKLACDVLTLRYTEDNQIREGTCEGNVKFNSADRVATAGLAELARERQTITLSKDVRIWQGENEIRGDRAKIFLAEQRMFVEGATERPVRTTIQSNGTSTLDFGPPELGAAPRASGAPKAAAKSDPKLPLMVRAERFDARRNEHVATYTGSVVATRGDVTLSCQELVIRFDANNKEVDSAMARGGVEIVQTGRSVSADTGDFQRANQRVVLTGKPAIARHDKDELRCQRIEYDQGRDELRCLGAPSSRVETFVNSNLGPGGSAPLQVLPSPRGGR